MGERFPDKTKWEERAGLRDKNGEFQEVRNLQGLEFHTPGEGPQLHLLLTVTFGRVLARKWLQFSCWQGHHGANSPQIPLISLLSTSFTSSSCARVGKTEFRDEFQPWHHLPACASEVEPPGVGCTESRDYWVSLGAWFGGWHLIPSGNSWFSCSSSGHEGWDPDPGHTSNLGWLSKEHPHPPGAVPPRWSHLVWGAMRLEIWCDRELHPRLVAHSLWKFLVFLHPDPLAMRNGTPAPVTPQTWAGFPRSG